MLALEPFQWCRGGQNLNSIVLRSKFESVENWILISGDFINTKIQELIVMCVQQQQQWMLLQKLQIMIKSILILMIMAIQSKRNCLKVIKSKRSSFDICKSAIEHKGILWPIAWYINPHLWILGHTEAGESHQGDQISAITSDHLHSGKIGRYL